MNFADKLQKYAASKVVNKDKDVIMSMSTKSAYFNFNGNTLRISDHLPASGKSTAPGVTLSIIITSDPNAYILQHYATGRLSVITYERAKEIIRSIGALSDIFRYPITPFRMEKEVLDTAPEKKTVLGIPEAMFTPKQMELIKNMVNQAISNATKKEKSENHLKVKQ